MQLHKLTCSYISLHAVTWACMQFPELACSSLSLHEVPWACMQFHELVCSSFLCLSSSQEFCSAFWWVIHVWVFYFQSTNLIFYLPSIRDIKYLPFTIDGRMVEFETVCFLWPSNSIKTRTKFTIQPILDSVGRKVVIV